MKKLLLFLIALIFLAVSCSSSKKAENDDNAVLPDEDAAENDEDVIPDEENPCRQFANSTGEYTYSGNGKHCGCKDGYFWANPGCRKITYANICTGQDKCYDNEKEIVCPDEDEDFFGQDVQYAELGFCVPQNFSTDDSVSNEPVVSDNNLKIEWAAEESNLLYTWDEAVKYCKELEYAGHDDWRLPSPQELIAGATCRNDIMLWSSQQQNDSYAWALYSISKTLNVLNKFKNNYVRCVRGEPMDAEVSFRSIDTELVMDYQNGLMWSMADYIRERNWKDAFAECEKSTAGGFSDWRLPNINELSSILNFEKSGPASNFPYPENLSVYFWASTTQKSDFSYAPAVNTASLETIKNIYKTERNHVICVRNEPCIENYFWDGIKCVESPCNANPCQNAEHSDGVCNLSDSGGYFCGCVKNYFRDGEKCVSPCDPNPCTVSEHTTGLCKPHNKVRYTCDCKEGYYWWVKNNACLTKKPESVNVCTGQDKCYDNEKEIVCPAEGEEFFGQDAQYAAMGFCAPQSFSIDETVPGEPVVVDNNTGMMWQQKIPPVKNLYIENVIGYCSNLVYGGYDDWRLPSITDFVTITDFGRCYPAADTEYFPDYGSFWTSNKRVDRWTGGDIPHIYYYYTYYSSIFDFKEPLTFQTTTSSYYIYGNDISYHDYHNYAYSYNIRCVRGSDTESTTFTSKTFGKNLMWNYNNDTILVKKTGAKHTWQEALKYCSDLDYAGISDWRLPNIRELYLTGNTGVHSSTTKMASLDSDYSEISKETTLKETTRNNTLCIANDSCEDGKFWNGEKCAKNPCAGNPCKSDSNSNGTCTVLDEENYLCGCKKGSWDSELKECIVDETPDADTVETPDENPDADTDKTPDESPDENPDADIDETPDSDNSESGE